MYVLVFDSNEICFDLSWVCLRGKLEILVIDVFVVLVIWVYFFVFLGCVYLYLCCVFYVLEFE